MQRESEVKLIILQSDNVQLNWDLNAILYGGFLDLLFEVLIDKDAAFSRAFAVSWKVPEPENQTKSNLQEMVQLSITTLLVIASFYLMVDDFVSGNWISSMGMGSMLSSICYPQKSVLWSGYILWVSDLALITRST